MSLLTCLCPGRTACELPVQSGLPRFASVPSPRVQAQHEAWAREAVQAGMQARAAAHLSTVPQLLGRCVHVLVCVCVCVCVYA